MKEHMLILFAIFGHLRPISVPDKQKGGNEWALNHVWNHNNRVGVKSFQ